MWAASFVGGTDETLPFRGCVFVSNLHELIGLVEIKDADVPHRRLKTMSGVGTGKYRCRCQVRVRVFLFRCSLNASLRIPIGGFPMSVCR